MNAPRNKVERKLAAEAASIDSIATIESIGPIAPIEL